MPSFTAQVPNMQQNGPIVEIGLGVGLAAEDLLRKNGQTVPTPTRTLAMIDTGATGTVVQEDIITSLNLKPIGVALINTPSSTNVQCYRYLMRLLFPNNVVVETVAIAAPLLEQNIQCLIGRDILHHAVFIYTGYTDSFTLSF